MAPFSIPAPCIIPLRLPTFGARRTIDSQTRIELLCDTNIDHEIFYTLDGTRPQPYAGIIQGSRLFKYAAPFCLTPGKVTVKALALHSSVRSMRSNVVTKCFEVLRSDSEHGVPKKAPEKVPKKILKKKKVVEESDCRGALGGTEEDLLDLDYGDKKELFVDEPCSSVEDFPCNDREDSIHSSGGSMASVMEMEDPLNIAKFESDQEVTPGSSAPQSPEKERTVGDGFGDSLKIEDNACIKSESSTCIKCETQHCSACNKANASTSKFCVHCGQRLILECAHCNETNHAIATFCQFCGQKMQSPQDLNVSSVDCNPSPKPQRCHASVQRSPSLAPKHTQTSPSRKIRKAVQPLPNHSPGRGYWHQQMDYICNHLKSYAYNNLEFRDSISEPVLGDFQTATVTKSEDSVSITLAFTPFTLTEKV